MDDQRQDDHLEPIYNSSVPIQDVACKTSREKWTIETGGERGSERPTMAARHDDDDDDLTCDYTSTSFDAMVIILCARTHTHTHTHIYIGFVSV